MNLLHLFDETEKKLTDVKRQIDTQCYKEDLGALKKEKEYLLDILALLFKELER
jgi:hypothetical protein